MYKSCSRCGKIHPVGVSCSIRREYKGGIERELWRSWSWQKKSMEIRDKAQGLCEVCRDYGTYTYKGLEVHHIEKVADNPDALLDDSNLVCLCVKHHKQADRGELSNDYLRRLAEYREHGYDSIDVR